MAETERPFTLDDFTAMTQQYSAPLFAFACGFLRDRDAARDLVQDTFCDAWRAVQQRTPPFDLGGDRVDLRRWLYRIAYRRAVDVLRRRRVIHWESLDADDAVVAALPPERISFEDQIAEHDVLHRALTELASPDAACLLLAVVQGFSAAEIAPIVGATPAAVAKRIARAKQRLLASYLAQNQRAHEETRS